MSKLISPEYETMVFIFRGRKVMVDTDLADLYGVKTNRLKEQVKRNIGRFPEDFMFELHKEEKDKLVANCDRLSKIKHSSVNPLVFTEQGLQCFLLFYGQKRPFKSILKLCGRLPGTVLY